MVGRSSTLSLKEEVKSNPTEEQEWGLHPGANIAQCSDNNSTISFDALAIGHLRSSGLLICSSTTCENPSGSLCTNVFCHNHSQPQTYLSHASNLPNNLTQALQPPRTPSSNLRFQSPASSTSNYPRSHPDFLPTCSHSISASIHLLG